jgi:hypothetical protein
MINQETTTDKIVEEKYSMATETKIHHKLTVVGKKPRDVNFIIKKERINAIANALVCGSSMLVVYFEVPTKQTQRFQQELTDSYGNVIKPTNTSDNTVISLRVLNMVMSIIISNFHKVSLIIRQNFIAFEKKRMRKEAFSDGNK